MVDQTLFRCFQSKFVRDTVQARLVLMVLRIRLWFHLQQTYCGRQTMTVADRMAIAFVICYFENVFIILFTRCIKTNVTLTPMKLPVLTGMIAHSVSC